MQEFHRATRKQRTLKLIVATLLLTYGNSVTRALLLTVAYYIYYFFCPYSSLYYLESLGIRPSSNVKLFVYWTEYLSIKVDPNDNSSTIDSIGLNSLHDVHGLQFTSENIVIYALGLEHERKVQRLKRSHSLVEIPIWAIRTLNSWVFHELNWRIRFVTWKVRCFTISIRKSGTFPPIFVLSVVFPFLFR